MSFSYSTRYPGRAGAPSAEYPLGSAIDETEEGAEDGTPFQADLLNDIQGFIQTLHALAGKTGADLTGVPDTVLASDIWDSLTQYGIIPLNALGPGTATISRNQNVLAIAPEVVSLENTTLGSKISISAVSVGIEDTDGYSSQLTKNALNVYINNTSLHGVYQKGLYHHREGTGFTSSVTEAVVRYTPAVAPSWVLSGGIITGGSFTLATGGSVPYASVILGVSLHLTGSMGNRYTIPLSCRYADNGGEIQILSPQGVFNQDPDTLTGAAHYYTIRFEEP